MSNRTTWNSNFAFLMAMIGSAVGLGNIWRFPYIFYTYGQGTFLIPYILAVLILGLPFLLIEYSLGYKFKDSLINIFGKISDKLQIVGWAVLLVIFFITTYYVCIVGWDMLYLALSFFKGWGANPDAFFVNNVLQAVPLTDVVSGASGFSFVPAILVAVLILWVVLWVISSRDLNDGVGAVSKVLVPLLFILIVGIVAFSLTLPGASVGLHQFFTADWSALMDLNLWLCAFGQIVFSLSLGMGIVLIYSSYLPEGTDLTKNALITICANCGFEIFNAIGIFAILGFMVSSTGVPFNELITEGTGLAFVAFPQVFNVMGPAAIIIGPIFFLCILIAGITSAIALLESVSSSVSDKFGFSRKKSVSIICALGFIVTALFTTTVGSDLITIFDALLNNIILIFLIICQCIIVGYIYYIDDLIEVLNKKSILPVGNWWKYLVKYITPIVLAILWISGFKTYLIDGTAIEITVRVIIILVVIVASLALYYVTKKKKSLNS